MYVTRRTSRCPLAYLRPSRQLTMGFKALRFSFQALQVLSGPGVEILALAWMAAFSLGASREMVRAEVLNKEANLAWFLGGTWNFDFRAGSQDIEVGMHAPRPPSPEGWIRPWGRLGSNLTQQQDQPMFPARQPSKRSPQVAWYYDERWYRRATSAKLPLVCQAVTLELS